jgi:hypothetical protein
VITKILRRSMIRDALAVQEMVIAPDSSDLFLSVDAQKWEDREHNQFLTLTAVLVRPNVVYIFANSTSLTTPLVCKLDVRLKRMRLVAVSPTLRQVLCVSEDSHCSIVPVSKFLNFIRPQTVPATKAPGSLSLTSIGFHCMNPEFIFPTVSYAPSYRIQQAFWWEPHGTASFIVFVETNAIHIFDVLHPDASAKKVPMRRVSSVSQKPGRGIDGVCASPVGWCDAAAREWRGCRRDAQLDVAKSANRRSIFTLEM